MFKRKIENKLFEYYNDTNARILILTGARQIGKTFIIRQTAKRFFNHYIEINLNEDSFGQRYYENVNSVQSFYMQLSAQFGNNLGTKDDTIIFLDEIQTYPHLLTLLKYLKEDGRYRIIASGSLLGITLKHVFIPTGYIEEVRMFPMDFEEFLWAAGTGNEVIEYLKDCFNNIKPIEENIHKVMLNRFKEYLICGGLPDAVEKFLIDQNIAYTRNVQNQIYEFYKDDATRYEINNRLKIRSIYDSLPSYLENKVKRINFTKIENKRNSNLEKYHDEFEYLISSDCTIPVRAVANPKFPLLESSSKNLIKLYFNDIGLLTNVLYKNNINALLYNDKHINLGSVYETVCAIELKAHGHEMFYFDSKKVGEVDFLINDYEDLSIKAVEIKSGNDQNNFRALPKLLKEPYNLKQGYVFGNDNIVRKNDKITTYPIYLIMFM